MHAVAALASFPPAMCGEMRNVIVIVEAPACTTGAAGVPCTPLLHEARETTAVNAVECADRSW